MGVEKQGVTDDTVASGRSAMIELDNICYRYPAEGPEAGALALGDISLTLERGESVALMGPNGCGKSTLLRLFNGLIFADSGTYRFDGQVVDRKAMHDQLFAKRLHQRLGFVFQNPDVQLFCPSVAEEVAFGPRQMGLSVAEVEERAQSCLELMGIGHLAERAPYHLSGGEKHKVALACVISMSPDVLVLDEPLSGLDEESSAWLLGFLIRLRDAGTTLLISTHHTALADEVAHRTIRMDKDHRIVEC